jgi:glucans biosynthesis protein
MSSLLTRRGALAALTATPFALSCLHRTAMAGPLGLELAAPEPFTFDGLAAVARDLARQVYKPAEVAAAQTLDRIDFEQAIEIHYRPEQTV